MIKFIVKGHSLFIFTKGNFTVATLPDKEVEIKIDLSDVEMYDLTRKITNNLHDPNR